MFWRPRRSDALLDIGARLDRLETAPAALDPVDCMPEVHDMHGALRRSLDALEDAADRRLDALEAQAKDFTMALAEGIERTDRAERRIQAAVKRAQSKLKEIGYEDPGLDAEAYELRKVHGDGGDEDGVRPVPEAVEARPEASSIKGVSAAHLQRVRGY